MRRGVTALVVAAVAAIGLAAGIDALQGDGEPEPAAQPAPERSPTSTAAEAPRASPAPDGPGAGVLYYTDESCELQAVELPGQRPAEAPNWDECEFVLSPDARRVAGAGSGWDPHSDPRLGRLYEHADGMIQVSTNRGPEGEPFRGEAPAWRPDGTLTYFADGAVRSWPGGEVVRSQRELLRAVEQSPDPTLPGRFDRFALREALWLSDSRLAAIVTAEGEDEVEDLLAVYDGRRLVEGSLDRPGGLSDLRASPTGRYVAARESGNRGFGELLLVEPGEGAFQWPTIQGYRAIAWSPDDEWAAVATDDGVTLFRPGAPGPPSLELALDARDLAWRGGPGPSALARADEVRDWLGGVGASGRLFVTLPGCTIRALRLPDVAWEEEPNARAPCSFTLDASGTVLRGAVSAAPNEELTAVCVDGGLDVFQDLGFRTRLRNACGPAWTGDGTLTFIRNGGLWRGIENARMLVSREQVGEIFGRPSALEEVAWLDDRRFWAVVRSGESAVVALMTTDRLVFSPSFSTRTIEGLQVSATGMVAARTDQGVVFFDSGGRRALTFPNGQAVAWAPGELFAAVATPTEVLFVAPVSREVLSLALAVRDLDWVVP
jgi:hypothetical protein